MRTKPMRWSRVAVLVMGLMSLLAACTLPESGMDDPKGRLTEYINKSFAVESPSDRAALLSYMTGESRARLAAWSEDQFRQAFIDSKRQKIKFAVTEIKSISANEVSLTYEVSYLDQTKSKGAKVTNKKLCSMVKEDGHWLIRDVKNIKELVEFKDEAAMP